MFQKLSLKYKIYLSIILVAAVALLVLNSVFKVVNCNMTRNYKSIEERTFQEIKDKIIALEKDELKDATTVSRLAQQYNIIGGYYLDRRLWEMAIDAYNKSVKYGNRNAPTYYSLGLAYANRGAEKNSQDDINKAEFNYRKAIEMDGTLLDAKYGLSVLLFYYRDSGRDEAQRLIGEILSKNRAHYPARFANARFNYELGYKEKSLAIYRELAIDLEKLPKSEIINEYRAQCSANIARLTSELSVK